MNIKLDKKTARLASLQIGVVLFATGIINYILQDISIPSDNAITLFAVGLFVINLSIWRHK